MERLICFEDFSNELFLDLFEYFSAVHLLRGFFNLNTRLNNLLFSHFHSFCLDFHSVSREDCNLICGECFPALSHHITSIRLSNDDDTPQQIELFLGHGLTIKQLIHLRSLSIYDLCSSEIINAMIIEWQYLPNLTHLTLAGCYLEEDSIASQELINQIWHLPKLLSCYLNNSVGESNVPLPMVTSTSLKYLFLWGIGYRLYDINSLFKHTPCLEHLSVIVNADWNNDDDDFYEQQEVSSMKKLKVLIHTIDDEDSIFKFFRTVPNLTELTVDMSANSFLNGYQWEQLIRHCLSNLRIFRLRMEFYLITTNKSLDQETEDLLNSFRSSFWLEEHRWFVRCHWYTMENSTIVSLHTLPYAFGDFHFYGSMQFKSTCPNDKDYYDYKHVDELRYTELLFQRSIPSPIRFPNIKQLHIELPIGSRLFSILPNLDRINSMNLSINNNHTTEAQLTDLINRTTNLDSLNLNLLSLSTSLASLFKLINRSIRRLSLRGHTHYLTEDECVVLSHSLLGRQCEILSIGIRHHRMIRDLLEFMKSLRTLNVQCADDTQDDDFLRCLEDNLPSSSAISRDPVFSSTLRIWIR